MTSMQAMSGAGRAGGVLGLDILDNVVPYIPKEEEKVQQETQKVLGAYTEGEPIRPADFPVSSPCRFYRYANLEFRPGTRTRHRFQGCRFFGAHNSAYATTLGRSPAIRKS